MTLPLTLAVWTGATLLFVGALGALYRIVRGPSLLDRAIATDVLLVLLSSGLILDMAVHRHTHSIMLVVIAATVGFVGSVTVARFVEDLRPEHPQDERELMRGLAEPPADAIEKETP